MSIRIKILPEDLINRIAAGEVVDRPASVVKELVENAIDAGATSVAVDIRGGGRSSISVLDNGSGMSREEALLAIERHATSKIASTEDLFAIQTLGFRGEALAAIAGVSKLELITRTRSAAAATRLVMWGGTVKSVDEVGAPVGTSMTVRDLFFNTPARLKFMKSAAVETGHIVDLAMRLAMSRDNLGMTLTRGPETLLQTSEVTTGRDRLVEVLGGGVANALFPFRASRAGLRVYGYVSGPELSRSGWTGLYAFVNGRFLRDRLVTRAIAEAYRGVIPKGRYPVAVVFIELDPQEVDVNVHPGKIEVRFARPRTVSDVLVDGIKGTLGRTPWVPGFSLGPQAELFEAPPDRVDRSERLERPVVTDDARPARLFQLGNVPDPVEEQERLDSLVRESSGSWGQEDWGWRRRRWGGDVGEAASDGGELGTANRTGGANEGGGAGEAGAVRESDRSFDGGRDRAGRDSDPAATDRLGREVSGILPGFEARNFSRMRVIGQYANCFIMCQDGDDLVVIDQHAAHERVTFEQLKKGYEGVGARNQLLLTPQVVELPRRDAVVLTAHLDELAGMGLEIEPFGGTTFAVKSMPVPLLDEDPVSLLTELASDLTGELARQPLQERIYLLLATMACHGSIRANRRMTPIEMDALLKLLDGTDFNFACPHGRPLVVRSTRREVEKLFKRT